MSELDGMIENAMKDPRFASILSSLKEKSDKGELDVASLLSEASGDANKPVKDSAPRVGIENHKKLLAALRPYLKEEKREAVDSILKFGEFSGVIETLTKKNGGE